MNTSTIKPALLAIDWGTTSLRGALLAEDGSVLDELSAPDGLLSIGAAGDAAWSPVFERHFGPWLNQHPGLTAILSGMVGSQQGWQEAAYAACPASLHELATQLSWVRPGQVAIVPGLRCELPDGGRPGGTGLRDVMRGEETQILGALALTGLQHAPAVTVILPGTHSKWVQVRAGRITGFATQMTGEAYALFRQHSILARTLPPTDDPAAWDAEAFDAGVQRARQPGGLLHHLFGVRTQALFKQREPAALASYLSGLLIGEELRAQRLPAGADADTPVLLMAGATLGARYQRALAACGIHARVLGSEASWQGLLAVARAAGILQR